MECGAGGCGKSVESGAGGWEESVERGATPVLICFQRVGDRRSCREATLKMMTNELERWRMLLGSGPLRVLSQLGRTVTHPRFRAYPESGVPWRSKGC
jgi:hypothetical protein